MTHHLPHKQIRFHNGVSLAKILNSHYDDVDVGHFGEANSKFLMNRKKNKKSLFVQRG